MENLRQSLGCREGIFGEWRECSPFFYSRYGALIHKAASYLCC